MEWLLGRDWCGNVRELENTIQRGVLIAPSNEIRPEHLQPPAAMGSTQLADTFSDIHHPTFNQAKAHAIERFEREYLHSILRYTKGNISHAAQQAHKDRRALGRLLKKHRINHSNFHTG